MNNCFKYDCPLLDQRDCQCTLTGCINSEKDIQCIIEGGLKMLPDTPIMSHESEKLEKLFAKLIGRHNVLCDIEECISNDVILDKYFSDARDEVLASGNQSLSSMIVLMLENMAEYIRDHEKEDNTDIEQCHEKHRQLESKYRVVKNQLDTINNILKEFGYQ